ncbi:Acetylglucosaminyltransferase, partial [Globisporangium splendens]
MRIKAAVAVVSISLCALFLHGDHAEASLSVLDSVSTVEQLWTAAMDHWDHQRVDSTLELLLQIEQLSPNEAMLPMALGAVYQSKREYGRALEEYQRALARFNENADLYVNVGQLYYETNDMERAIASYHRAVELNAAILPRIAHLLALAYHYNQQYGLTEKYYGLVETRTAQYHFDFAVTLERLGKKVLELPNTESRHRFVAMTNIGAAYEVMENVVAALHWFEQALEFSDDPTIDYRDPQEKVSSRILVLVHMARSKRTACVWRKSEEQVDALLHLVLENEISKEKPSLFMPFDTLMYPMDPHLRKQITMVYANQFVLLDTIPKLEHLKCHHYGGIFLDTFIYGAHSTATDALHAGLPFLTLAGDSHASRVGISLLANIGMDELVTFSRKEYEDMAGNENSHKRLYLSIATAARMQPICIAGFQRHSGSSSPATRSFENARNDGHSAPHSHLSSAPFDFEPCYWLK